MDTRIFLHFFYTVEFWGIFLKTPDAAAIACAAMKHLLRDIKIQNTSPLCSWFDLHQSSFLNRVEAFNSSSRQKQPKRVCLGSSCLDGEEVMSRLCHS